MNTTPPVSTTPPADDPVRDPMPRYTAGEGPVTPLMRRAFQVWVILFLFMIVFTLGIFLYDKFRGLP